MGDFEKELRSSRLRLREEVDTEKFIENLENRIIQKNNRQRSFIATSILVLFFGLISIPNLNKEDDLDVFYTEEEGNYFDVNFWTIQNDSMVMDSSYFEEVAYFLVEEGNIWETIDFFNKISLEKEES
ncbi:hypothetical protein OAC91_03120 [Candidatus Marinimicrobia bacterium]|nr:hypothetical protein [Candidatus Neomarinimicrobiota bacterium]